VPVFCREELLRRFGGWFPVRVAARYVAIGGYDRALALATQVFVALVPMLIVVAAAVPGDDRAAAGGFLVDRLQLSGSAAADLQQLMQRPPGATEPVTLLSAALLVVSVVGFTRTLQRTYQAAWLLPTQGLRGFVHGLLGAAALVVEVVLVLLVGLLVDGFRGAALVTVAVNLVLSVLLWWPVQRLLLAGRVTWRQLLPGAVLSGVGQVVVITLSGVYLQVAIETQAARYGLIGVAFVLVSWMVVLGLLLVLGAVLGAEAAYDPLRPRRPPPGAVAEGVPDHGTMPTPQP
jgi:membrane protein